MNGRIHAAWAPQRSGRPGPLSAAAGGSRCKAVGSKSGLAPTAQQQTGCTSFQHSCSEQQQQQHHHSTTSLFQQQQQQQCSSRRPPHAEAFYIPSGHNASSDAATSTAASSSGSQRLPAAAELWFEAAADTGLKLPQPCSDSSTSTSSSANSTDGTVAAAATEQPAPAAAPVAARPGKKQQRRTKPSKRQEASNSTTSSFHRGSKSSSSSSSHQNSSREDVLASKRLTSNISQAGSWQQLQQLLQAHGDSMNHIHAAALLSTTSKLVQHHQLDQQQQQEFAGFYGAALQLAYTQAHTGAARPRELSSMLWSVAKVGLHPGQEWLGAYLAAVQPQLGAMNAQDLGLLVWALARFQLVPEPGFCSGLLAAAAGQFAATGSSSSSTRSSGKCGSHGSSSSSDGRPKGFDSQGLCNVLWGLAVLELNPGQAWLSQAAAAAGQLLQRGTFKPQGISVLLWALARFGCRPPQQWLHAAADTAVQQLYAFKPAELAMMCHALARLHYQPPQAQQQQGAVTAGQQQQQQQAEVEQPAQQEQQPVQAQLQPQHLTVEPLRVQQQQQPLLEQVQLISWSQLRCLHFAEAANLVWAMGVVGQRAGPAWVQGAVQQLQAMLQEADAKALASACYGLAKQQHHAGEEWWQAVWQHVPRLLCAPAAAAPAAAAVADAGCSGGHYDPHELSQSLATFLWAVTKLGVQPPADVAEGLLATSQQLLQQRAVNGAEVMAMTVAAAVLQLQPPSSWLTAAEDMLGVLLLHSCNTLKAPLASSEVLSGVQHGQQEGAASQQSQQQSQQNAVHLMLQQVAQQLEVLQQVHQEQAAQLQQPAAGQRHAAITPKEVCNAVFSLARLRHVPGGAVLSALQQYVQQCGQNFSAADWQQLQRALQSLRGQLQQRNKAAEATAAAATAAAAAAAVAHAGGSMEGVVVGSDVAQGSCLCGAHGINGSSSSSLQDIALQAGLHQGASCWQAASSSPSELGSHIAAALAAAGSTEELRHHQQQQEQQEEQHMQEGMHAPLLEAPAADLQADLPAEDSLLLYGHYLSLPLRANGTNGKSRAAVSSHDGSSVATAGFLGCAALELAV